jgi:ABC-type branched-subunit amino acid transport system ATPase component
VIGVVISVLSFNATRIKEAEARRFEAERPFLELRRSVYLEAVKTAAVLSTPEGRPKDELEKAKLRFRELYVAELSMVEDQAVEQKMVELAIAIDPELRNLNSGQRAALELARALRDSYITLQPKRE